ncbi:hypothetical protein ACOACO_03810 [Nocardioides sp. CPCC 205120]|uniref:hypothetical protein n=1 Tax=Nocardioides sp. CPCC 205120 TaxID=3406462 RepID=UPI003B5114A4
METCPVCGSERPLSSAFCAVCGTPTDATNVRRQPTPAPAWAPPQPAHPQPPAYPQSPAFPVPPQPQPRGSGVGARWVAGWVALAVVLAAVAGGAVWLVLGQDDAADGDERPVAADGDGGIELGAVNELEVVDGEAELVLEADKGQVVLLHTEAEGVASPDYEHGGLELLAGWGEGDGYVAWTVPADGEQVVVVPVDGPGAPATLPVLVDVVDAERLAPGDPVGIADGREAGVAVYQDLGGTYALPAGMVAGGCGDGDECPLHGDQLVVVEAPDLALEEVEEDAGETPGTPARATFDGEYYLPQEQLTYADGAPGTWTGTVTVASAGTLSLEVISLYDGDLAVEVRDPSGAVVCSADAAAGPYDSETCAFEAEVRTYAITVTDTATTDVPAGGREGWVAIYAF